MALVPGAGGEGDHHESGGVPARPRAGGDGAGAGTFDTWLWRALRGAFSDRRGQAGPRGPAATSEGRGRPRGPVATTVD